jgi:hypothetical protein
MKQTVRQLCRGVKAVCDGRKVNFLVVGTQKGATTALHTYLQEHPQICMSQPKEVHYFDNERLFRSHIPRSILNNYYRTFFNPLPHHKSIGESTPIYMYWSHCAERIWEYNPDMKIIMILRNPIDRAFSHWNMERSRSADSASFSDAIRQERQRCRSTLPLQHRVFSYIDRGFYSEQIRRLWRYFPKSNTLALKTEELKKNPSGTLGQVTDFLELDSFPKVQSKEVHVLPYVSSLPESDRDYLSTIFRFEIRTLEQMLGWDCADWLVSSSKQKNGVVSRNEAA